MITSQLFPNSQQPAKGILLVEDDHAVTELTQEILLLLGHHVTVASNGFEAMRAYTHYKNEIDLVITDLDMPVMDGRTLVSQLRADNPHLNIIIITGNVYEAEKPNSPLHQVARWLSKPFRINELEQALDALAF